MKICFIPIDNRPVCWELAKLITECDEEIEFFIPPREILGGLTTKTDVEILYNWLQNIPKVNVMIVALDTIAYGGLVASRRTPEDLKNIKTNLEKFKSLFKEKANKILAFSSIMRISNNNYNIEEKEYWSKYGKKIFDYSYHTSKSGKWGMESCVAKLIPDDILNDYMSTRRRNFEINKLYLEWQKEGIFDLLIFSKDDCAEYGFNVDEAKELEKLGGKTMTGADEIPLTLLARALDKSLSICPIFTEETSKELISKYEDISVEASILRQTNLAGFEIKPLKDADIALIINNFKIEQGEIVMKVDTEPFNGNFKNFLPTNKPFIIADVRYANGADNKLVKQLFELKPQNFIGYAAWNTTANSVGSLLCMTKYTFNASKLNNKAYAKLLATRFLDDWAYQANIRQEIDAPTDIKEKMLPFIQKIENFLNIKINNYEFKYPWNRLFETEVVLELEINDEFNRNYTISNRTFN